MNMCLFFWLAMLTFQVDKTIVAPLVVLVLFIFGVVGSMRLIFALEMSKLARAVFLVLSLVPIVNLIPMFLLGERAGRSMRRKGFSVGMFQAKKL